MTRILFVDDEANVLSGLRRMLHSMAHEWEMVFFDDPIVALEAVKTEFFDIIVSDLRMPQMDGVTLLQEVRKHSPETVRIALSGYADRDATLRALSQIHQFLSKPCEPDGLKHALMNAVNFGKLLTDERLRRLLAQMETLPSIDNLFDDVVKELQLPDISAGEVGELIAKDASMSAKVLQLVNSALFGLPQVISDPVQATIIIGLDTINVLVLSVKLFDEFIQEHVGGLSIPELWQHCVDVARLAKRLALAECASEIEAEQAFLGGLLHDIGRLALANYQPDRYRSVVSLSQDHAEWVVSLEDRFMGGNHAEVGAYLMGLWGFAEPIIDAIYLHHAPSAREAEGFTPLAAVHIANAFLHHHGEWDDAAFYALLDRTYIERLGMLERIPVWREMAQQAIGKESKL